LSDVDYFQEAIKQRGDDWYNTLNDTSQRLSEARYTQASLNEEKLMILRRMNHDMEVQAQEKVYQTELERHHDNLKFVVVRYETLQADLIEIMDMIKSFETDRDSLLRDSGTFSSSGDALGPRGIQTFIIQNAVYSLEILSPTYLDELSGGTLKLHLTLDSSERITRSAEILGAQGQWLPLPMSSLSGGQWRRCSLAMISFLSNCRNQFNSSGYSNNIRFGLQSSE